MYKGCCFSQGILSNTVHLKCVEDVLCYINSQVVFEKEARIIDPDGHIVLQIVGGIVSHPSARLLKQDKDRIVIDISKGKKGLIKEKLKE